ncbi:MAG: hypothetical protein STSR0009_16430 [Methanoregula sp.]
MTDEPCPGLVDEDLLEQAIPLFSAKKIAKTTLKEFFRQLPNTLPDIGAAQAACESAIVPGLNNQDRMKAYLRIADRLNEFELFDSAAFFYHKAVLTDPTDPTVWVHQGLFYFKQEKFIVALACFLNIPSNIGTIYVAKTLNSLGWHDQARACLNTLHPTKDEEGLFYLVKAECLYAQGDYQDAFLALNTVIDNASSGDIWFTYAQICVKAGEFDGLIRSLPHFLPHVNVDSSVGYLAFDRFSKCETLDWIDDLVCEAGLYGLNKEAANRFLLTILVAHREKPERVTARINAFLLRTGADFDTVWQEITKIPSDTWDGVSSNERLHPNARRHEMVRRMAVYLEKYEGDARGLWSGVTAGEVLRRLEEIGFGEAVNDYLMRVLFAYRDVHGESGEVWDEDPHVNRVLARYILGQDALPAHPDVVYHIRKYFRHVDAGLHRIGTSLCKAKVHHCSCCRLSESCVTSRRHGYDKRCIFWESGGLDEDEDYPYSFYVGEEVCLAGTSVQGTVTRELQESLEDCILLADIEDLPEEVGAFYDLIQAPPLVKNQKC